MPLPMRLRKPNLVLGLFVFKAATKLSLLGLLPLREKVARESRLLSSPTLNLTGLLVGLRLTKSIKAFKRARACPVTFLWLGIRISLTRFKSSSTLLLLAAVTEKDTLSPAAAVWWSQGGKEESRPQRVKLLVRQMGEEPGPDLKAPTTVRSSKTPGPQWSPSRSRPQPSTGACLLARGLDPIAHSGHRGIFLTSVVPAEMRPNVAWLPKEKELSHEHYLLYVQAQAQRRKASVAYRQGGGADLGLVGVDPLEYSAPKPVVWKLFDTPRSWLQEDVKDFLAEQSWRQIQIITRKKLGSRRNSAHVWIVKALPPEGLQQNPPYTYADDSCCITVAPDDGPRKPAVKSAEQLQAPRRKRGAQLLATKCSGNLAARKSVRAIALVVLRDRRYRALKPPLGCEIPFPWLAETESRPRSALRGGGRGVTREPLACSRIEEPVAVQRPLPQLGLGARL